MNNSLDIVEHHIHYLEIDGFDETVNMQRGAHTRFHNLNPGFPTPHDTVKSRNRNYLKYMVKKTFYYHPEINIYVKIDINYSLKTGHITISHGWSSPNTIRKYKEKK